MTLSNLSLAFEQLGLWPQAIAAIADSLKLLQTKQNTGDSEDHIQVLAQALDIQGRLQLALGQAEQALATWQKATATYASLGDRVGETKSRISQVQALQALGLYLRAEKTLTELKETPKLL